MSFEERELIRNLKRETMKKHEQVLIKVSNCFSRIFILSRGIASSTEYLSFNISGPLEASSFNISESTCDVNCA